jgi:hypothetical protein
VILGRDWPVKSAIGKLSSRLARMQGSLPHSRDPGAIRRRHTYEMATFRSCGFRGGHVPGLSPNSGSPEAQRSGRSHPQRRPVGSHIRHLPNPKLQYFRRGTMQRALIDNANARFWARPTAWLCSGVTPTIRPRTCSSARGRRQALRSFRFRMLPRQYGRD